MKRTVRRSGWLSALLGVTSVLVALAIGHSLTMRANTATPSIETSEGGAEIAALALIPEVDFPPAEAFATVVDRPLFSATRLPPAERIVDLPELEPDPVDEPEVAAAPPPPIVLGQFALVGVIDDGSRRVALVRHPEEVRLLRIAVGDVVRDWRVMRIGLAEVELASHGVQEVLTLKPTEGFPIAEIGESQDEAYLRSLGGDYVDPNEDASLQ